MIYIVQPHSSACNFDHFKTFLFLVSYGSYLGRRSWLVVGYTTEKETIQAKLGFM